jgi:hypothetical protein
MISNGGCGLFIFDTATLLWYSGAVSGAVDSLVAGAKDVSTIAVPATTTGTAAMVEPAPTSTDACQPSFGQ